MMKYKQRKLLTVLLAALLFMLNIPMLSVGAITNTYYVSPNGSDEWAGTMNEPFLTLSHAASVMQAGDTCYVRSGIYRETLEAQLKGTEAMPIRFEAYENEEVTISGADELSDWSQHEGNIYVTDMNWDVYNGDGNIVFADGELCIEGKWPNSADLLDRESYARIDSKDGLTIYDADLPSYSISGADVWIASGVGFWSYLSEVTEHDVANHKITLEDVFHSSDYRPIKGNIYYISGSLALLDSANEWYKDTEGGKLYFYAPNGVNPNNIAIEARKREYAINLSDSSYVTFDGINVRGALVNFGDNTNNCTFTNATVETVDCDMPTHQTTYASYQPSALGIMIGGSFNTVSKSEIKNMYGEGITLSGSNNRIINNYIHDINFEHTYSDGIYITGKNHLVSHNTIEKTGRGAIGGTFDSCVISYNDVSDASRLSRDAGVLYFNAHNYQNSEIHHNIIHSSLNNEDIQCGLYFDSFTSSMIVYNNLIYGHEYVTNENDRNDDRYSLLINPNSLCNLFINNTVINYTEKVGGLQMADGNGDRSGSVFLNNLFYSTPFDDDWNQGQDIIYKNNLVGSSLWADVYNSDLTLCEGSAAIDSAIYVPGINDSYIGDAPDCGALEYGEASWSAGHDFNVEYDDEFVLNEQIPFKNLVKNSGFENRIGDEWDVSGTPERFYVSSWSFWGALSKDGYYSLKLKDNDRIEQKFTGLKPNTTYELGLYGRVSGNVILAHKFAESKDSLLNSATVPVKGLSDGMWIRYDNVDFGDGNTFDKIGIGVKSPDTAGTAEVYIDSLESTAVSTLSFTASPNLSGWVWSESALSTTATGNHSVYIKFNGNFSSSGFGAFYLDSESSEDSFYVVLFLTAVKRMHL